MKESPSNFISTALRYLAQLVMAATFVAPIAQAAYTDNGNGTVTDTVTGLTWMRCSIGQNWNADGCNGIASSHTLPTARALTATFAGQSDWRLPTIRELHSIVDRSVYSPAIDKTSFPNTPDLYYWSTSAFAGDSRYGWCVDFFSGYTTAYCKQDELGTVRLVRGTQSTGQLNVARPTSDYVDHGDGTITHAPSNLTWKRCAQGQSWTGSGCTGTPGEYGWDAAMAITDSFAGHTDWHLPTAKEIETLLDYTIYNPAINSVAFPTTAAATYWSASIDYDADYAWYLDAYNDSLADFQRKSTPYQVRLVRNASATGTAVNVASGWNLLGNGANVAIHVASTFGDQAKVNTAWKWLAAKNLWAFYTPTLADGGAAYANSMGYEPLTSVAAGEGFWVNARAPFTMTLPTGAPIDSASFKNMASSWNLIATGDNKTPSGFNTGLSTTAPTTGQIPDNLTSLWAWDAALAKWYFYAPSLEQSGALASYVASNGYLSFGSKTLSPTSGFWVNKASSSGSTTLTQKSAPMTTALGGTLTLDNGAQLNAPPAAITSNGTVTFSQVNNAKGFGAADASHTVYELAGPIDPAKASFVFPGKAGLSANTISVVNYDTVTGEGAAVPFTYDAASGRITVTAQPTATAASLSAIASSRANANGIMSRLGYLVEYESLYTPLGGQTIQTPFYEHLSPVTNPSGTSCWAAAATMLVKSFTLDRLADTEMLSFLTYLRVSDDDYGSGIIGFSEILPRAISLYAQRSVEWRGYVNFTNLRSRLLRELDNGHPVILRWPGHVVLAVGYQHLGDGNYNIVLHDPKGVTPQDNEDGGMYSVRSWDWIRAKTWTGAIQLMWAQGEVQPARSLQTMGLPSGTDVGAVEFLARNMSRTQPSDESSREQYHWSIADQFGHAWFLKNHDKVAAVGLSPYTATQLRLRLPLWNAASIAATVQVRARIYDKNLATLYNSPVQSVSLGANQARPVIHEILIPVSNFRKLDLVDSKNQIEFRVETEMQDASGTVFRDGWSENNMRGSLEVKPWITTLTPNGDQLTIDGYSFGTTRGSSLVVFPRDLPGTIVSWSETRIVVKIPSGASAGDLMVHIGTSNGNIPSNPMPWGGHPAIAAVDPVTAAPGTAVTISGSGFGATQGSGKLSFGGILATIVSWSDSKIVATVPTGATTGAVTVEVSGVKSNAVPFTVSKQVTISGSIPSMSLLYGANLRCPYCRGTILSNTGTGTWSMTGDGVELLGINSIPMVGGGVGAYEVYIYAPDGSKGTLTITLAPSWDKTNPTEWREGWNSSAQKDEFVIVVSYRPLKTVPWVSGYEGIVTPGTTTGFTHKIDYTFIGESFYNQFSAQFGIGMYYDISKYSNLDGKLVESAPNLGRNVNSGLTIYVRNYR